MAEQRPFTIGVLSPLLSGAFFGMVLQGAAEQAAVLGGRVVAIQARHAHGDSRYPWRSEMPGPALGRDRLDAYVSVLAAADDAYLGELVAAGKPVVLVNHHVDGCQYPEVMPEDLTVTGADNDDLVVEARAGSWRGHHDLRELGRRAAALVAEMLTGTAVAPGPYLVPTTTREGRAPSRRARGATRRPHVPGSQGNAGEDYSVSLALGRMSGQGLSPKSLGWLRHRQVRAACLALWENTAREGTSPAPLLRVAGPVGPGPIGLLAAGSVVAPADFPPVEAFATLAAHDDVLVVLPVRAASRFWGFLALVCSPQVTGTGGGDMYLLWTALLGTALDHEALVGEIRASEERYALAARAANDGLWDWDVTAGTVFYSSRWKTMLGFSEDEVGSAPSEWFSRVHPDDLPPLESLVAACLEGTSPSFEHEHRTRTKAGAYRWALCRALAVPGPNGRVVRIVGSLTDITERKELESRLRTAALYDSLTGLPNRSLFMDRLLHAVARAKRSANYQFCVLFMDLDGFKSVNDSLGHMAGDLLLIKVAERITRHLRQSDTAVRFGGDEFAILLDNVSGPDAADAIVERLQRALSEPYLIDGHEVVVTATIGWAASNSGYENPEDMVRDADTAMYSAKGRVRPVSGGKIGG